MTEPALAENLTRALHRLRAEVRQKVPAPASADLRAAATRQVRVRRGAGAGLVAATVAAVGLGAAVWGPGDATRPPAAATPVGDVDWLTATIDLPAHPGCPDGPVRFGAAGSDLYGDAVGPADPAADAHRVYLDTAGEVTGDLTGDGAPEAVLPVACGADAEDSLDGEGQLLVVGREPAGLRGLAWVGPRGAVYDQVRIDGGVLYVTVRIGPGQTGSPEWTEPVTLRYTWDGSRFVPEEPAGS